MHEALKAAVEERMRLAREAHDPAGWDPPSIDAVYPECTIEADDNVMAFLRANDPAFVIRACERDLKVLERHQPGDQDGGGKVCWDHTRRESAPWPCDEIEDLAEVYQINPGVSDDS